MSDSIYWAEHIVCGVDASGVPEILHDAALLVEDGKVVSVGPRDRLAADHPSAKIVRDHERQTLLPGFFNGHHHIGATPIERGMPDLPLEQWVIRRSAEIAIDPYLDALYGAVGMISAGITGVMHLYANKLASPETMRDEGQATIRAYRDAGMRVSFAVMFFDQNALGYVGSAVAASLPADEAAAVGGIATDAANMSFADHKAVLDALAAAFADDPSVQVQLAPANLHWCSHRSLEHFAELAHSTHSPVHMHLLETKVQRRYADWRTAGRGPVDYLRKLGFSGATMTLGHGTWIAGDEIGAIADAGFSVCHNCSSNLRLSSGLAPVGALLSAGVNVALGIDEAGLNDDHDMLQEMRLALHLSKTVNPQLPYGLGAGHVLSMATSGGARSVGWGGPLGRLAAGHAADFIAFDHHAAAAPGRADQWSPVDILLLRGRPAHIAAVFVAGEVIARDGQTIRVDRHEVEKETRDALHAANYPDATRLRLIKSVETKVLDAHAGNAPPWFTR